MQSAEYLTMLIKDKDYSGAALLIYYWNRDRYTVIVFRSLWDTLSLDERQNLARALRRLAYKYKKAYKISERGWQVPPEK
jgi:hypothetical protein